MADEVDINDDADEVDINDEWPRWAESSDPKNQLREKKNAFIMGSLLPFGNALRRNYLYSYFIIL